ncbi:uncharacterized protein [Leptinotarsa decemlineata]|uniref:uncharacterized protein n=1 Tax=Leptinotarsa decemlineata TaxID=7539 RepID=UPI003D309196
MSRKMTINRLDKDELEYESKLRGIGLGTCEEMRHRLANAFRFEKSGESLRYPTYPFTFEEDLEAVTKKLDEDIAKRIEDFSSGTGSSEVVKIQTKFAHVFGRVDRMDGEDDEDRKQKKANILAKALSLFEDFMIKLDGIDADLRMANQVPPALSILQGAATSQAFQASVHSVPSSSPRTWPSVNQGANAKMIPPHKWSIEKFSGNSKSTSVSAFFEMVEELRLARNVPPEVLLESGLDLFVDKAYQFYKECRRRVNSWEGLVEEFREEYLSANHNEALFEELRKRTQHPTESIGVYLAVMSSYFSRLRCPVHEEVKLSIIIRNLHPFYQDRLRDPLPTTIDELRIVCRKMEARRDSINSYVEPPTRRMNVLEKDLAFVEVSHSLDQLDITSSSPTTSASRQITCFRCNQVGHRAIGCALPKKIYCFKCKAEGFTSKNCPKCAKEGNGVRRS